MEKKMLSTLLRNNLLKEFKKLAIDLERPINDLLEEAIWGDPPSEEIREEAKGKL